MLRTRPLRGFTYACRHATARLPTGRRKADRVTSRDRDMMLFDQSNEVCRCIPCERRFYEVWIRRYEMFRLAIDVGEITSAPREK